MTGTSESMANLQSQIGFIQGRLSELVNGRIQAFPAENWESEFEIAQKNQLTIIEWTIDTLTYLQNPLIKPSEIERVVRISRKTNVRIPSVTCDLYMENPHWESKDLDIEREVKIIIESMPKVGANILVIPLVDNSSISNRKNTNLDFFMSLKDYLRQNNVRIAFELDLEPEIAGEFIKLFNPQLYGINYDIGNSASLGFNPAEEMSYYGHRVINVHVKDRLLGGNTVPLGLGSADFKSVLEQLKKANFSGNFIMQTARAGDGDHETELLRNIDFFKRVQIE